MAKQESEMQVAIKSSFLSRYPRRLRQSTSDGHMLNEPLLELSEQAPRSKAKIDMQWERDRSSVTSVARAQLA